MSNFDPDTLPSHIGTLRSIARQLVRGEDDAEDLVQDTMAEAIENPPNLRIRDAIGNWLAVVLRNRARRVHRTESRRKTRETFHARPEVDPSAGPDTHHHWVEACRTLLDAVEALPEPYRTAITLRFFEQRPPREIAARLGIPVATVRTRITRALGRLRTHLEDRSDPNTWRASMSLLAFSTTHLTSAAVPPAAAAAVSTPSPTATALTLVNTKSKVTVALGILLGAGLVVSTWILWTAPPPAEHLQDSSLDAQAPGQPDTPPPTGAPALASAGEHPDGQPDAAEALSHRAAITRRIHEVRVSTTNQNSGRPAPAVDVTLSVYPGGSLNPAPDTAVLTRHVPTNASGHVTFQLEDDDEPLDLSTTLTLVIASTSPLWSGQQRLLVVPPTAPPVSVVRLELEHLDTEIRGRVSGPLGEDIADAIVHLPDQSETRTDAAGRYSLRCCSEHERIRMSVCAPGFAHAFETVPLPAATLPAAPEVRTIVHDVTLGQAVRIRGTVRDSRGQPIHGATLYGIGSFLAEAKTDIAGEFALDWISANLTNETVVVGHPNFESTTREVTLHPDTALYHLEITLHDGLSCRGVVVDRDGNPVEGAKLYWRPASFNNEAPDAVTEEGGRFHLRGGQHRWQRLIVSAPHFALERHELPTSTDTATQAAIDDVRITLKPQRHLSGHVVDVDGEPLAGIPIFGRMGDGGAIQQDSLGLLASTLADGSFFLDQIPLDPVSLAIVERGYYRVDLLDLDGNRDDLEVTLHRVAGLAGAVRDAITGAPVTEFTVRMVRITTDGKTTPGLRQRWFSGFDFRNPKGHWDTADASRLRAGTPAGFQVLAEGYAPSPVHRAVSIAEPQQHRLPTQLQPGVTVAGEIVTGGGGLRKPVRGALVFLLHDFEERPATDPAAVVSPKSHPQLPMARTDASGHFEIPRRAHGRVRLLVSHPDFRTILDGPFEATLETGRVQRNTIELTR